MRLSVPEENLQVRLVIRWLNTEHRLYPAQRERERDWREREREREREPLTNLVFYDQSTIMVVNRAAKLHLPCSLSFEQGMKLFQLRRQQLMPIEPAGRPR